MQFNTYQEYARSAYAEAVQFVRKYLNKADDTKWVDIVFCRELELASDVEPYIDGIRLFRYVSCALFPKIHSPEYPSRHDFGNDHAWRAACAEATWHVATRDIASLKRRGYFAPKYAISGQAVYQAPASRFVPGTPPEILRLLDNPNDYTNPLWEKALAYEAKGTWVFSTRVKRL